MTILDAYVTALGTVFTHAALTIGVFYIIRWTYIGWRLSRTQSDAVEDVMTSGFTAARKPNGAAKDIARAS